MTAYRLLAPAHHHPAGTIVYPCRGWDYGCSNDDTRRLGYEHKAMTLDPTGDYPFITVAVKDMEEVKP